MFICTQAIAAGNSIRWTNCPSEGINNFVHPMRCSEYIMCVHGHEILRRCAPNTCYDAEIDACSARDCSCLVERQ